MHSDDRFSFWHLFFISDLYKTVSVKIFLFSAAPDYRWCGAIRTSLRFLSFSSEMLRPLPLDTPITFLAFSYAGRKALSAEKLLIFCSSELSDKLWRAVGVPGFCFAVHRTRLLSFFECTSQVRRRLSARSFSPSLRLYYSRCFG